MPSGSYKQIEVQCPFYKYDDGKRRITCEGIIEDSSLALIYHNKKGAVCVDADNDFLNNLSDATFEILVDNNNYEGDRNDYMLSCNAGNSVVRNNIACSTDGSSYTRFFFTDWIGEEDMNGISENNIEVHDPDHTFIPGYENGDYTIAEDSEVFATGFVRIPIEEIGRVTNE